VTNDACVLTASLVVEVELIILASREHSAFSTQHSALSIQPLNIIEIAVIAVIAT
jgi:hypothetical protein